VPSSARAEAPGFDLCVAGAAIAVFMIAAAVRQRVILDADAIEAVGCLRSRTEFRKYLTRPNLLGRPVVMVIGENPSADVDDPRAALVTVEPNMPAGRAGCATDPQLTVFDAIYFPGQIDGGEHRFCDAVVVGGCRKLSKRQASGKEDQTGRTPGGDPQSCSRRHFPQPS